MYTGPTPIQTGVISGTITCQRAAVVRGRVIRRDGQPLGGAIVSVLNQPEFEQRLSSSAMQIVGSTPEQFGAFIRSEVVKWARVVKISNAVVN